MYIFAFPMQHKKTRSMKFTKMHGTGNDYIYVNGLVETIENPAEFAIQYSDWHKGIGSDGLVMILASETCDFRMRMFNADGSESEMCGNASRCIGKYVYDKGLTNKTTLTLETLAGVKALQLFIGADQKVEKVTVDMGEPILDAALIPVTSDKNRVINEPLAFNSEIQYNITTVSMGNPHAVIFTTDILQLDLPKIGPVIENATIFPRRTNTEFIEVLTQNISGLKNGKFCIFGRDEISNAIILRNNEYIKIFDDLKNIDSCNIAYIANDKQKMFKFVGHSFRDLRILTIATFSDFSLSENGMIEIQLGRRNFEIIVNKKTLKANSFMLKPLINSYVIN